MINQLFEHLVKIDELTLSGVNRKQQSITSLFPDFADKVRGIAQKGGLRLIGIGIDTWHFKIHSGTQDNLWYDNHLHFKNVPVLLSRLVKDRRLWTRDGKHVDLNKLSKEFMFNADVKLDCTCPAQLYWGGDFILSLSQYDAKFGDRENRPPNVRNPRQHGAVCKHLHNLLTVLPWYTSTAAKWLKDFYVKEIGEYEKEAQAEHDKYHNVGKELGKIKDELDDKDIKGKNIKNIKNPSEN